MNITIEEYLKLLENLDDQYGSEELDIDLPEDSWIPSEPATKEKILRSRAQSVIDVSQYKKDKIKLALYSCDSIRVNSFIIHISNYTGLPNRNDKNIELKLDISVFETKYKTPSGNPCKMDYRVNFSKDDRFKNRPWLNYFSTSGTAHNIPVDTVIEVVNWMQIIKKLSAFL